MAFYKGPLGFVIKLKTCRVHVINEFYATFHWDKLSQTQLIYAYKTNCPISQQQQRGGKNLHSEFSDFQSLYLKMITIIVYSSPF